VKKRRGRTTVELDRTAGTEDGAAAGPGLAVPERFAERVALAFDGEVAEQAAQRIGGDAIAVRREVTLLLVVEGSTLTRGASISDRRRLGRWLRRIRATIATGASRWRDRSARS
jgi:hypothetical protein